MPGVGPQAKGSTPKRAGYLPLPWVRVADLPAGPRVVDRR